MTSASPDAAHRSVHAKQNPGDMHWVQRHIRGLPKGNLRIRSRGYGFPVHLSSGALTAQGAR
jgi:hypothetical protein